LKVRFIGYLRTRVTSVVSSASDTNTTSRKRSASDYRLASSTPRRRPSTCTKETRGCSTDSDARIVPTARRSLAFIHQETNCATVQTVTWFTVCMCVGI